MLDDECMTDTRIDAIVIYTDASSEYPPRPTKVDPTFEVYSKIVEGYLEAVDLHLPDGAEAVMYVNEEGRIHGLPINPLATSVVRQLNAGFGDQVVVGNAIIVGVRECDDDEWVDDDVPPAIAAAVQSIHNGLRIAGYGQTLREQEGRAAVNTAPDMVSALILTAGRTDPPRPQGIYATDEVFARIVGSEHLQKVAFTSKYGDELWMWGNGQSKHCRLTYNELATRLYQALSPVPTRQQVLGNVIITAADDSVPWSVVKLAQRIYLDYESNLTSALAAYTERGVG